MPQLTLHTPLGEVTLTEEDGALVALDWGRGHYPPAQAEPTTALLREAAAQLHDYFDGRRTGFDLPLAPAGSPFRQKVWAALCRIPHGETRSYLDIAREVGCRAPRAVGGANGANPLPILIPCHRVIAADGSIGGYSGHEGLKTKRELLAFESRAHPRDERRPARPGTPR